MATPFKKLSFSVLYAFHSCTAISAGDSDLEKTCALGQIYPHRMRYFFPCLVAKATLIVSCSMNSLM